MLVIIFRQLKQTGKYKNLLKHKMNFKTCTSFWHVCVEKKTSQLASLAHVLARGKWKLVVFINAFVLMKWNKGYSEQGWSTCFPRGNP